MAARDRLLQLSGDQTAMIVFGFVGAAGLATLLKHLYPPTPWIGAFLFALIVTIAPLYFFVWPWAWKRAARNLGFERVNDYESWRSKPDIEGEIRGREVRMKYVSTPGGHRGGGASETVLETDVDAEGVEPITVVKSGLIQGASSTKSQVETGDERFDDEFDVVATDEGAVKNVLTADVRDELLDLDAVDKLSVNSRGVTHTYRQGILLNPRKVRQQGELLATLADRVERRA